MNAYAGTHEHYEGTECAGQVSSLPAWRPFVIVPAPRMDAEGRYVERRDGRPIRVYTQIDVRLMFGDLVAKLRLAG